jgi:Family of unknown function (DUF5719)
VILRRLPFVAVGALIAGLVVVDRAPPEPVLPSSYGARLLAQTTPAVNASDLLSTSWFCPGGPTTDGRSTSVTVFNTTDDPKEATVSAVTAEGATGERQLMLPPRSRQGVNLAELAAGEDTAATVAVYGGGVAVEQTVLGRSGVDVSPCADTASGTWFLADGTTTADAALRLVLYNPFPDDAVVDVALTTVERTLEPPELQGAVVPGHSVRLIDVGVAAQREEVVSAAIRGRGARLVMGRIQSADNAARRGFSSALTAAQAQQTWWFPSGDKGEGIGEKFVVFNPGDQDASVELSVLSAAGSATAGAATASSAVVPVQSALAPISVVVPPNSFAVVDTGGEAGVPPGPHSTLVNVVADQTPVVVERLLSRVVGDRLTTTSLLGSQLAVPRWYVANSAVGRGGSLVIMNSAGLATTAAVKAVGPAGAVPIKGLDAVPIPAGGAATVVVPPSVGGFPLFVDAAQPVVVEWQAPVTVGDKTNPVSSLAFPVVGG